MPEQTPRFLLNSKETCFALGGISRRSLEYLVIKGLLQPKRIGRRTFFHVRDVERFAQHSHPESLQPDHTKAGTKPVPETRNGR